MAYTPTEQHIIEVKPDKTELKRKLYCYVTCRDWKKVEQMFKEHPEEITPSTRLGALKETVIHIATKLCHNSPSNTEFVKRMVKLMNEEDLDIKSFEGETAFSYAVRHGLVEIARIMLNKKPNFATTRTSYRGNNLLPIEIAAVNNQYRMVSFLYPVTKKRMEARDCLDLFFTLIDHGSYDIARLMLSENPGLAIQVNSKGVTALYAMAGNVSSTCNIFFGIGFTDLLERIELIKELLKQANGRADLIKEAIFRAAAEDNVDFLTEAFHLYPDLATELDENNRTIFHIGAQHRHANIFNMIRMTNYDNSILDQKDTEGNNILDLAAKLPFIGVEVVWGAGFQPVFQLQRDLRCFEEVNKVYGLQHAELKIKNYQLLFNKEHEKLRMKAEKWLTNTANSGMPIAALIFSAAMAGLFTVPDSYEQVYPTNFWFKSFGISYAATSLFSAASVFFFLSILTCSFSMRDFAKSLPSKLLFGLFTLYASIIAMMIAFVSAFFVHFEHPSPYLSYPVAAAAFMLIILASHLQLPLLVQVFCSTFLPLHSRRNRFFVRRHLGIKYQ
ncbi:Ankyrin repeat family protein [Euphorbia peplus]|nr:Ankyrin repeat family protein [Euphorbia peplus]